MARLLDFFRRKRDRSPSGPPVINLAFVLLSEARLPRPRAIIDGYRKFEPGGELEVGEADATQASTGGQVLSLESKSRDQVFIALVPAPVPQGEADDAAQFSVGSFGTGWTLPPHGAHLVVTSHSPASRHPGETLSRFTSLLAAVAQASGCVGIYWGSAGATHGRDFFASVAADQGIMPRMTLWTGVSIARESESRMSLLSLGMQQLQLPDLLLGAPASESGAALATFFDLLAYLASRGEPIPEGDTVGRSADERLTVRYVASPIDPSVQAWRVDLP